MQLEEKYLNGSEFHNSYKYSLKRLNFLGSTNDFLEDISRDKNVVHIGCTDHDDLIDKKIENNTYLHSLLVKSSSRCIGIDVNAEALKLLESKGIENLYCHDITKGLPEKEVDTNWDLILLPDVLEHIDETIKFLTQLRENFPKSTSNLKLLITVPNALKIRNFRNILSHVEEINTDHRAWYTPFTLSKIVTLSGWKINKVSTLERFSKISFLKRQLLKYFPILADTIVIECEI